MGKEKETLARKPPVFEKSRSPANGGPEVNCNDQQQRREGLLLFKITVNVIDQVGAHEKLPLESE